MPLPPQAVLAEVALPPMLANAGAAAFVGLAAAPDVLAGGRSAAAHSQRVLDHAMPNTPKHAKTHEKNGSFLASYSPPGRAMAKPAGADVAFRRPSF